MTDTPDEKSTAVEKGAVSATPADTETEATEATEATELADATETSAATERTGIDWAAVAIFGLIPALALILALAAGYLKFADNSASDELSARTETVQVAKDSTVALLSYQPDKVEQQLNDARALLTGPFEDQYVDLTTNVVIPGAKQKGISAVATVPQAASVSADEDKAVVLVFVNQTVVVGTDAPTSTASSVRVTLAKTDGKWLISKFDPI